MKNRSNIYALFLLDFFLLLSCKQQEQITWRDYKHGNSVKEIEENIFNGKKEIESIKFEKINFKININGEKIESGGSIAIMRDSVIVISLTPMLGYEMARIFCLKDSILILDRVQKICYSADFSLYLKKFQINANYDDIESVLMNQAFRYERDNGEEKITESAKESNYYLDLYYESSLGNELLTSQEIKIIKDINGIEKHYITDRQNHYRSEIEYDEFRDVDKYFFPFKINFHVTADGNDINLMMNIGNISLNETVNAEILVPSRYRKEMLSF